MQHFSTSFRPVLSRLGLLAALGLMSARAHAQTAPTWASVQRSTSTGANSGSNGRSIAIGADGSQYVTGVFGGNVTLGTITLTAGAGDSHLFLAKYSAAGTVLWANKIDADSYADGKVAIDAAGNAYLTGDFESTITLGATTLTTTTSGDAYLVKYDAQGVQQWVRQGGAPGIYSGGIATDAVGNVLISGSYNTSVAFGGTALTGGGLFFYRFSPAGAVLTARTFAADGFASDLTLDNAGNAYIVGGFGNTATFGTTTLISAGSTDIFLCKLDATGAVVWARRAGGANEDSASEVAVDANGNPFIGGYTDGASVGNSFSSKIYVARYNNQGTELWTRQIAPSVADEYTVQGVAYDGRGGYYITGSSAGTTVFGTTTLTSASENTYVVRYNSQGTVLWAGQSVGPTANDLSIGFDIAADGGGNVYVTGAILGTVTFGSLPASTGRGVGTFLAKINAGGVVSATSPRATPLELAAYPNPASEHATLVVPVAGGGELLLVDALGRTVRKQALPAAAGAFSVSLAGVNPGLYQLRAMLNNGQVGQAQVVVR